MAVLSYINGLLNKKALLQDSGITKPIPIVRSGQVLMSIDWHLLQALSWSRVGLCSASDGYHIYPREEKHYPYFWAVRLCFQNVKRNAQKDYLVEDHFK